MKSRGQEQPSPSETPWESPRRAVQEKHPRHQREEDREQKDRPDDFAEKLRTWEANGHDSSRGQCGERTSPQEEGNQVGCHAHVIAEGTTRGKAHFCGERRTRTEKGRTIVRITFCELPQFIGPENLKKLGGEKRVGGHYGCPVFVNYRTTQFLPF
jgi:hypothetical protein